MIQYEKHTWECSLCGRRWKTKNDEFKYCPECPKSKESDANWLDTEEICSVDEWERSKIEG